MTNTCNAHGTNVSAPKYKALINEIKETKKVCGPKDENPKKVARLRLRFVPILRKAHEFGLPEQLPLTFQVTPEGFAEWLKEENLPDAWRMHLVLDWLRDHFSPVRPVPDAVLSKCA